MDIFYKLKSLLHSHVLQLATSIIILHHTPVELGRLLSLIIHTIIMLLPPKRHLPVFIILIFTHNKNKYFRIELNEKKTYLCTHDTSKEREYQKYKAKGS